MTGIMIKFKINSCATCYFTNDKFCGFQEEYISENIQWSPIEYFNNAIVVELLEGKRPPGLFLLFDDVCATLHGGSTGADADLQKVRNSIFERNDEIFTIILMYVFTQEKFCK